jgi:outer membrane protein, multidrug efflux system
MRKAALLLAPLLASAQAFGQTSASPQPTAPLAAPSASSSAALTVPPPPQVDDPMLAPVAPPKRLLTSWQEAVTLLRARSTDLKIALDQVLQAEAATRIALAQYLPSIVGNGVYTHQLITKAPSGALGGFVFGAGGFLTSSRIPTPDSAVGQIQVQQDIINAQEFDQISIDELSEDAARLTVDDKKRTLALSVANQIVAVVTAERAAEINRVGLRVALEQAEIAVRKRSLGAANGLDVVRAKQNAANARATLVTGDESLHEAREALGLALGLPEEISVSPNVDVSGLASDAAGTCRVVPSVDDRADVAAARTQLQVAKRNLQNVWYTFIPTITAQSTLAAVTPIGAYPNPTWNIQGVLQIPIWDGGTRYGNLRNARAAQDIAAQQLEALKRQAIIQVEQARRQLVVAEQSAKVALEQRDLAAQNDQMTQLGYMTGQGTSLELVTASEAHRQAELNLALLDFDVVKARLLAILALATCPW